MPTARADRSAVGCYQLHKGIHQMTLSSLIYEIKSETPGEWDSKKEFFTALDKINDQVTIRPSLEAYAVDMITDAVIASLGQPTSQWQQRIFNLLKNSRS